MREFQKLKLSDVVGAFAIFLVVQIAVVPLIALMIFGNQLEYAHLVVKGWINICGISLSALGVGIYCRLLQEKTALFFRSRVALQDFLFGIGAWVVAFPTVLLLGHALGIVVSWFFDVPPVDQVAVKYLKSTFPYPSLFAATVLMVVVVAPVIEEILFRGFLQTWLQERLSSRLSVALASLIFALFHVSSEQGVHNIELLVSLFALSCVLGILYQRCRSLWSSMILHITFNLFSVIFILS